MQAGEALEHVTAGTAAAIAVAEGQQRRAMGLVAAKVVPRAGDLVSCQSRIVAVFRISEAMSQNATPVDSFPKVEVVRKRISFVPGQLMREKEGYPCRREKLREVSGEPERVWEPRYLGAPAKSTFEKSLTKKKLPNPRFAGVKIKRSVFWL